MNRAEFEHIIRAAAAATGLSEFVVIGSQAVLAIMADAPRSLRRSVELDLYPATAPERSIEIDGAIGELSLFHQTHGIYAHGVGPDTACLPMGWETRCTRLKVAIADGVATVVAPELHDLACSKLVAGREKDIAYVAEMLRCGLIRRGRLQTLVDQVGVIEHQSRLVSGIDRLMGWLSRQA